VAFCRLLAGGAEASSLSSVSTVRRRMRARTGGIQMQGFVVGARPLEIRLLRR
jgi:hypothetical protein